MSEAEKKELSKVFPNEKELVELYRKTDYPLSEGAKSRTRLDLENGSSNFIVNELGDNAYSDENSRIGMMIPFVREALENLEEKQAEDEYERNKRKDMQRKAKRCIEPNPDGEIDAKEEKRIDDDSRDY